MATNAQMKPALGVDASEFRINTEDSIHRSRKTADLDQIGERGLDSYRLALISPQLPGAEHRFTGRSSDHLVVLPITWKQFLGRVNREPNTSRFGPEEDSFEFGEVRIDFDSMEVRRSKRLVSFTSLEFKVLKFFVLNPNKVLTRDDLLNQVWGYDCYPCTRTVDNLILKLRKKLESDSSNPVHFRTVHGVGYKFVP